MSAINGFNPYSFYKDKPTIDGQKGPYDGSNPIGAGANAGLNTSIFFKQDPQALAEKNIQYTVKDKNIGDKLSLNGGLAYAQNALLSYDTDGDKKVTIQEVESSYKKAFQDVGLESSDQLATQMAKMGDLNDDGIFSAGENLAQTLLQDFTNEKGPDGIVTPEEAAKGLKLMIYDPAGTKERLQKIYDKTGLAEKEKNFEMPKPKDQGLLDKLMQLFAPNNEVKTKEKKPLAFQEMEAKNKNSERLVTRDWVAGILGKLYARKPTDEEIDKIYVGEKK